MQSTVSIVINTWNRGHLLPVTLASLRHLDYPDFEVIVVNGPSTDDTMQVLDRWRGDVRVGHCPEANLSMSRNIGIAMAAGEFVAFIDDDAVPEPEWLSQAIAAFNDPDVAAAGGRVFDHTGYDFQYEYAMADRLGNGYWTQREPAPNHCFPYSFKFLYLQGTNTVFRRVALLEVGGFDEEFAYYLDETDVCLRLTDAGHVICQLPNAYVHHKYAPSRIRSRQVAKYRYPVLKSKVYFSHRHATCYRSAEKIDLDNLAYFQIHRNDVQANVQLGTLTAQDWIAFEEHAAQAWRVGKQAAAAPPRLLAPALLDSLKGAYKRYRTRLPDGRRLVLAFLCEDYPPNLLGGIARFSQDKARAIAAMGHIVHVLARSQDRNTVDLEDGVWVHRIVASPQPRSAEASALDVPQSHWDQSRCLLDELDRISGHRLIDVVEAPVWNIVGIAPLLSGRYHVITSLMTTLLLSLPSRSDLGKGTDAYRHWVQPLVRLERHMVERSAHVLSISAAIANEVERAYGVTISPERLTVAHLGMPDWAALDRDFGVARCASRRTKVLFVGRLEKRKGVDLLLEVIPGLLDRHPDVDLHLVGDDSIDIEPGRNARGMFQSRWPALAGNRVVFHGKVDETTLRQHYADCDVFVAPSRFESFGLIYLEAMMFAKPVIGTRSGGVPEVVADGITGLLAEPGDAASLASALDRLLGDPDLCVALGRRGRAAYERAFTDRHMAESCVRMYRALVGGIRDAGDAVPSDTKARTLDVAL